MMKIIFLCSYFAAVASTLPDAVSMQLSGKSVAFIPTASIHDEYTQYVEEGKTALKTLGMEVRELELTQYSRQEIAEVLDACDCIYISGGNTFFLMQELRETGADKLIRE